MQVVLHAGAHFTDDDRLIGCLLRNAETLKDVGVYAPDPRTFRRALRSTLHDALYQGLRQDGIDTVHDSLAIDPSVTRLILSNHSFFGTPKMAVGRGLFYPAAEARLDVLRDIFAESSVELFLGLRNPATWLPALFANAPARDFSTFLSEFEPEEFRWSETIIHLRHRFPDMPITLWCNEDSPVLWGQILREMSGLGANLTLEGEFDLLKEIITDEGRTRFDSFISKRNQLNDAQKQRVVQAFLETFVKVEEIEVELDLPGWDTARVETLTAAYDADVDALSQMPDITVLTPQSAKGL